VTHFFISSVKIVAKDLSTVDISEKVKYRNAIPTALKPVSGGLQNAYNRTWLLVKCDPLSDFLCQKSCKRLVKCIDISETVKDRNVIPSALENNV